MDTEKCMIVSDIILDSQQYYRTDDGTRTIEGKTIYPSNYKESDIRAWLNNSFFNTALSTVEKAKLPNPALEVDNSVATTPISTNRYVCENTNDNIFLLSYQDAYNSSNYASDAARRYKPTDYAKVQGIFISEDSSYRGNSYFWLRSPHSEYSDTAWCVNYRGFFNNLEIYNADYGVVPSLWVTF